MVPSFDGRGRGRFGNRAFGFRADIGFDGLKVVGLAAGGAARALLAAAGAGVLGVDAQELTGHGVKHGIGKRRWTDLPVFLLENLLDFLQELEARTQSSDLNLHKGTPRNSDRLGERLLGDSEAFPDYFDPGNDVMHGPYYDVNIL